MGLSGTGVPNPGKKISAKVGLIHLDDSTGRLFQDCFKQFGIQAVPVSSRAAERMHSEKFEGCVVRLGQDAHTILNAVRNSPSNRRMVVYGISPGGQASMQFSKYGINAVIDEPVERQTALKVVRSTHLLVLHELRRYARVPLSMEVAMDVDGKRLACTSLEISAGGMSLQVPSTLTMGQAVEVKFELPGGKRVQSKAAVCWLRHSDAGVRFDFEDERRLVVKEWIEDYLDI